MIHPSNYSVIFHFEYEDYVILGCYFGAKFVLRWLEGLRMVEVEARFVVWFYKVALFARVLNGFWREGQHIGVVRPGQSWSKIQIVTTQLSKLFLKNWGISVQKKNKGNKYWRLGPLKKIRWATAHTNAIKIQQEVSHNRKRRRLKMYASGTVQIRSRYQNYRFSE